MAFFPLRIPSTSKPPLGTPIDWSNPLAQGLTEVLAYNEAGGKILFGASGKSSAINSTYGSWAGEGYNHNGQAGYVTLPSDPVAGKTEFTLFRTVASPTTDMSIGIMGAWAGDTNQSILVFTGSDNSTRVRIRTGGSTNADIFSSLTIQDSKFHSIAITLKNATLKIYIDGKETASAAVTAGAVGMCTGPFELGRYAQADSTCAGEYSTVYISSDRALAAAEIAALSANPWQIYEPEIMWVNLDGTLSGAALESAIIGQSTTSADLTTAIRLSSSVAGSSLFTVQLTTAIRLQSAVSNTSTVSAQLTTSIRLSAVITGQSTTTADLQTSTSITLAATIIGQSTTSANLTTAILLQSAVSNTSTVSAQLTTSIRLSAAITGQSTTTAELETSTSIPIAATIVGQSTTSANLTTAIRLAATIAGLSSASATLFQTAALPTYVFIMPHEQRIFNMPAETRIFRAVR